MTKPTPTRNLQTMLNLTPTRSLNGDDAFSALTLTRETERTYGGQVLAQAMIAAQNTVTDKALHSIHAYFLRPGDITEQLIFTSQRLNDSRSFATRRVQALQDNTTIFSAIASFQAPSDGPDHTAITMPEAPEPENLPSVSDYIGQIPSPIAQAIAWERPIDIRYVSRHLYTAPDDSTAEPSVLVWFKTFDPLVNADGGEVSQVVHQAAIAYASDYLPLEPALRAHGKFWLEPGMKSASLDHAMWFHRHTRADQWLLYALDSPTAQGGRMLARGSIFTRDGQLVATIAQEMMFRLPEYR